jgi:hypothetical protein
MPNASQVGRISASMVRHQSEYFALQGRHGLHRVGAADGIRVGFREAKMLYLALLDQILHRSGHILDGHIRVHAVLVKQIDGLDPQALERCLGHPPDLVWAAVQANAGMWPRDRVVFEPELGGNHHLPAIRLQRFTHQFLVGKRPVHYRGVEEGHAAVDCRMQESDHFLLIGRPVAKTHPHTAQPERRDF